MVHVDCFSMGESPGFTFYARSQLAHRLLLSAAEK